MSSDATTRLERALAGRYRIQRELGQGGMATVYLADDIRHDRKVAVKVLRPELAAIIGAERFLAEIRVTANLQHPHILPLHDSGEAESLLFYVMPFVEGVSLRERLNQEKQLPVSDAVRIASEVASALDYAHRRGVIHRDIKPENILFHDGRVVVADFGIALAATSAGDRMTETGMSLGTPCYMSPEQATGERTITARSDIYALGAVLYEMLTGEPPFTGPTAQAIVAKVLTTEVTGVRSLRRSVPPHVEGAVMQALEKLPADRFGSAAEFAAALANPSYAAPTRIRVARPPRERLFALLPWLLLGIVLVLFALERRRGPSTPSAEPVQRFSIVLLENAGWINQSGASLAISRDGRTVAYTGRGTSANLIYLRHMDRADPVPVPATENGGRPIFSPDGRWIGFIGNSGLQRAAVAGGTPEALPCRLGGYVWMSWMENNTIVFADGTGGLRQCSLNGQLSTLLANDSGTTFNHPHGLPGDRGVLFSLRRGETDRIAVLDLHSGEMKPLEILGSDPRYVETGHLVYVTPDGTALAVRFDLESLTTLGEPVTIARGVLLEGDGTARMAVSLNGVFIMVAGSAASRALELVDRSGRAEPLTTEVGDFYGPPISPDGKRIAVSLSETTLWVLDRSQRNMTRLPLDGSAHRPVWTPDGRRIGYVRQTGARVDLRIVNADGSAPPESLLAVENLSTWAAVFARDGRSLVVRTVGGPGVRDIWLKRLDSASPMVPLLQSPANELSPSVSPDGKWLAYNSNESGRPEIYVRAFPGMENRTQISIDGGTEPMWSPRGNELFYRSGAKFIAAEVRTVPAFEVTRRTVLFTSSEYGDPDGTYQDYDVSPDGRSFVMVRNLTGMTQFLVTLNLFTNLDASRSGEAMR